MEAKNSPHKQKQNRISSTHAESTHRGRETFRYMEEEALADQEEAEEVTGSLTVAPGSLEARDFKRDHKDVSWEGEFVKIETDDVPFFREDSPDTESVSRQIPEAGGKVTQQEIELERLAQALQRSTLENAQLKHELSLTRKKFDERERSHIQLEREHKRLQEKLQEAEENFAGQLAMLQEALHEEEAKNRQLMGIKEAFDSLNLESESSKKNTERLERELQSSVRNHWELMERLKSQQKLHEVSETVAASSSNRILELEEITRASNAATEEVKLKFQNLELEFKAAENRNIELEQQLILAETNHTDVQRELKESNEKIFELEAKLQEMEAGNEQANRQIEEYKAKLTQVELALSQARLHSSELEEELKKVVEQSATHEGRANATHQRSRELEDLLQNSHSKVEGFEKRIGELESLMAEQKGRIQELEEQITSLQKKYEEAQTELKAHQLTVFELRSEVQKHELSRSDLEEAIQITHDKERNLTILLQDSEEEKKKAEKEYSSLIRKLQETERLLDECKGKIAELESALTQSRLHNINLEEEMKRVSQQSTEQERRADTTHKRNLELEHLLQSSHSKFKDVNEKTSKLELLLKAEKGKVQELEEQISKLEDLYQEAKVEAKANYDMVSHLKSEVEKLHLSTSSLEEALELANEKETELTELLNASTEEKSKSEKEVSSLITKLHEIEDESEQLKNEATVAQRKLVSLESDLKATGHREREVMEKLKLAEDQLKQEREAIQKVSTRNSELEALHVSLVRDSERKIDEAMKNFTEKESEAKTMFHRLQFLEDQVQVYEEQAADAAHKLAMLAEDLDLSSKKVASLERSNEDLKELLSEAGKKTRELLEHNMMLASTNEQLQSEFEELLQSANYEKESVAQQVVSHLNTIRDLTDKLTKSEELQSATETRALQAEALLKETTQILAGKELEEKVLNERFIEVQDQVRAQENQARQASEIAKMESDQTKQVLQGKEKLIGDLQQKLGQLESHNNVLTEANMTLGEELAGWESKVSITLAEKEDVLEQLNTSKKALEDLMQRLTSEKRILELEIAEVKEESHLLHEALGEREKEHKGATGVLEDQLSTLMRKFQESEKLLDDSKGKIADLESALTQASSQNCELRAELKKVSEQRTEHEERANTTHQRSLELEDLLQSSHSRFDGAEKKASELESLLEAERRKIEELEQQMNANSMKYQEAEVESKAQIRELEEQMSTLERKYQDTEVELKAQSDMVSELKSEAEKLQLSTSHLEEKLRAAKEKEKTMTEIMDAYAEGKRKSEEEVNTLIGKLEEAEGMLERLRGERESIRNDLKASTLRETNIMENLRSAQDQLQQQGQVIQEATARNIELQSLHESWARDSRLKLHDATERIKEKEMEVNSLSQKLKLLEEQLHVYEEQASEAADKVATLLGELHLSSKKIASLEFSNEELRKMVSEAEVKARESLSGYNILVDTNAQLQNKVEEVQARLDSAASEKKLLAQQAASQMNTIRELTDQHTRSRELLSANEGRTLQAETQLQETNAILAETLRKNTELEERIKSLQALHDEARGAVASASKRNIELDEIIQAANAAAEEVKLQRRGLESKLKETEDRNVKLEQQLILVETNRIEAERELKQSFEKLSELGAKNKEMETENEKLNGQFEEYKAKLTEMESALSQARLYSSKLEEELKKAIERTAEHEGQANATHQRSRELEDLLQNSHSKVEGSEKRMGELEALLEEEKQRVQELEEQISSLEKQYKEAKADSKAHLGVVSQLRLEVEKLELSNSCFEEAMEKASDKERSLTKLLKENQEERNKAEEDSAMRLKEAIEKFTAKDSEVKSITHEQKLLENRMKDYEEQAVEEAHKMALLVENLDLSLKRRASLESSNKELRKMISEAEEKARESLEHNSLLVDRNQLLQDKVNELQELLDFVNCKNEVVARQVASHLNPISELTDQHTTSHELQSATETQGLQLEMQLEETTQKLAEKELDVEEMKERFTVFKDQVNTLENEVHEASKNVSSKTVELEWTEQKLREQEEMTEKLEQKLGKLESCIDVLTKENIKLNEDLAESEYRLDYVQTYLSGTLSEKEAALEQITISKKVLEDSTEQLNSEKQVLESEISSVKVANSLLHEAQREREKEHSDVISHLEERLTKYKLSEEAIRAEVQNLKVKSAQKMEFQANLMELEEQFVTTEAKLQKEVTTVQAASALRQEDMMTSNLEQHVEKVQDRDALAQKVLQLEQKLQLAHSSIAQLTEENSTKSSKSEGVIKHLSEQLKQKSQQVMLLAKETKELREKLQVASRSSSAKGGDAMEAKSRDYSTSVPSVTKKKSMRRAQISVPAQTFSSSKKRALPVAEVYYALDFKFVLGVALVSMVVGIILGKRY